MRVCLCAAVLLFLLSAGAHSSEKAGLLSARDPHVEPRGEWVSPPGRGGDVTLGEQWLSYWLGSGYWVWWVGPERSVMFDPDQFAGVNYPVWIKMVRSSFFEQVVQRPWGPCSLFTYKIYGDDGSTLLKESDTLAPASRDGSTPTLWDLGPDSIQIPAGTFWVAVSPLCDSHPSSYADSVFKGHTYYGTPGSWSQFLFGELSTEVYAAWTDLTHDVSVIGIVLPGFGVWADSVSQVRARVKNNGLPNEDFGVEFLITTPPDTEYIDTVQVAGLAPDSSQTVVFTTWTPLIYDNAYSLRARTLLATDENALNDEMTRTTRTYEYGEIAYDDFEQDGWWAPTPPPNGPTDAFAQKLAPYIVPPFVVTKFKIYVDSIQPFDNVRLCPGLSDWAPDFNNPYQVVTAPAASSPPEWIVVEFDTLLTHMTTLDPVWLCAQFVDGVVGPSIGADGDGPFNLRSYWTNDLSSWNLFGEDLFMRVVHKQTLPGVTEGRTAREAPAVRLRQNSPNPFKGATSIMFSLAVPSRLSLKVYDVAGGLVRTLESGQGEPGVHMAVWDGNDDAGEKVGGGVYFCKLVVGDVNLTMKMVMVR